MDLQILTLCLGFGGWLGVIFSAGAFFVNDNPLDWYSIASHSTLPFLTAVGFTAIVKGTQIVLHVVNMITSAMLDQFVIVNFLQILINMLLGLLVAGGYYGIILSIKEHMYAPDVIDLTLDEPGEGGDEDATDEEETDEEETDEDATDEDATDEDATDEDATDEDATDEDTDTDDTRDYTSQNIGPMPWWPF